MGLEAGPPTQTTQHRRDMLRFVVEQPDDDFVAADFGEGVEEGTACSREGRGWVRGYARVRIGVGVRMFGDKGEEAGHDVVD